MTGAMKRKFIPSINATLNSMIHSVRQYIRDGHPDFPITGDQWPSFLYPHARGDVHDLEKGFLKAAILVKV